MIGTEIGYLTIIDNVEERTKDRRIQYKFKCICGNTIVSTLRAVNKRKIKTCGCIKPSRKRVESPIKDHPLYRVYNGMLTRCYNKNHMYYEYYGGRGIFVCDRWRESFKNFVEDMGERPLKHTLDRIDNLKGYSPDNCKWSTAKEQAKNRRPNRGWRKKRKLNEQVC